MKKKLRIVFNTWTGAMFQKGGGEVQLLQTKAALERLGHEVLLFDQWAPQIDVDVAHQFSTEPGTEHFVKKYRQFGIPVAISTIMWTPPPKEDYQYWRIRDLMDRANILFPNSHAESEILSRHFEIPREKFVKTCNAISNAFTSDGEPSLFRDQFGIVGPFVLAVANIDRRKNTKLLVQACAKEGLPLITIGHVKDPEYYSEFEGLYSGYRHLGPIEDEEMLKSAYAACSVYALPSLCETPGIAALEAASQGANVVVTSEGCAEEYFGRFADYVDYRSVDSISSAIAKNFKQKQDPAAATFVRAEFDWAKTAQEVLDGYSKIF